MSECCAGPSCCSAPPSRPETSTPIADAPFLDGAVLSAAGPVPRVSTTLTRQDRLGTIAVRFGVRRSHYSVDPGLYAVGTPDASAPVLVTANYKLTFDAVRAALSGRDVWLLVIDTRGVNVWCAAGKGTFGTAEIIDRVARVRLGETVGHRTLIVPQLGAPGIAAHEVRQRTGFRIVYGPVQIADAPAFLDSGLQASDEMRRVRFGVKERLAVTGVELAYAWDRRVVATLAVLATLAGFGVLEWRTVMLATSAAAAALVAGALFTPLALPYLPGRSFALKGACAGAAAALLVLFAWQVTPLSAEAAAVFLGVTALSSFIGMNFTGSTTFTSLSGVQWEMRRAVPVQIFAAVIAAVAVGVAALGRG